jgi:MFS family permease
MSPQLKGLGAGMIYMPSIIIVGYYFESKRSLATGIAVCGSGVGSIVVPPLANFVLTYFESWTYVVILFGGMFLSCAIFGCLMKPLDSIERPDQPRKNNNCSEDNISNDIKTKLLTNSIFLSMCLCYFVANLGMNTPYVYLSNMAELRGITKEKSDYLLSIIGKYMRITNKVNPSIKHLKHRQHNLA